MWRVLVVALALAAPVRADDDWHAAPRPEDASGVAVAEPTPVREHLLWIPRAVLFVPRWIVWGVAQPARGGAYAYERYELPELYRRTFFTDDLVFGIYPTVIYESGYGLWAGARLVHRDLFGRDERIGLHAIVGGSSRQSYGIDLHSGRRIPHVAASLAASYDRRPDEPFYGVGDDTPDTKHTFRENLVRTVGRLEVPILDDVAVRLTGALALRELMESADVDNVRGELELVYDSRRPTTRYAMSALDATGWRASVYGGLARGIDDDVTKFTSYGGELQRFFDLYRGTRVLALRVMVDAIDGDASFIDLPRLGGPEYLRGYPTGRFRDRAATLATVEYTWDLGNYFAAYLFVDAGRVWPSLRDVELDDPRVGYGLGVQLHTSSRYVGRVQIGASRDGDIVFDLVWSPAMSRRERLGRY